MEENYEELLHGVMPDERMVPFLQSRGELMKHAIIYSAAYLTDPLTNLKRKVVKCVCSSCQNKFYEEYAYVGTGCRNGYAPAPFGYRDRTEVVVHGMSTLCPECGAAVQAIHVRRIQGTAWLEGAFAQEVRNINGVLVLLQWRYGKYVDKDGRESIHAERYNASVCGNTTMIRMSAYHTMFYTTYCKTGFEQRKKYLDDFSDANNMLPIAPEILTGTPAENSKLDIYLRQKGAKLYPVSYLRLYLKHKNVENLLTGGAGKFLAKLIEEEWIGRSGYGRKCLNGVLKLEDVNFKEKRPSSMLGLNRDELRRLISEKWTPSMLRTYKGARERGEILSAEELKDISPSLVRKLAGFGVPIRKAARYLKSQGETEYYLADYYTMAQNCGHDLSQPDVRWPKDLKKAHDRVMKEQKYKENEKLREAFLARAEALERFAWEHEGILIRPVGDERELIDEGDALHHCVATYAKRHAKGDLAILLIRKVSEPDKPWYTLNLDEKKLTVTENRGNRNCARTPEIAAFEKAWLEHIRTMNSKKKKETAA